MHLGCQNSKIQKKTKKKRLERGAYSLVQHRCLSRLPPVADLSDKVTIIPGKNRPIKVEGTFLFKELNILREKTGQTKCCYKSSFF
jgi:hypothetical protein